MFLSGILMNVFNVYLCILTTFEFLLDYSTASEIVSFKADLKGFIMGGVFPLISGHIHLLSLLILGGYVYAKENSVNRSSLLENINNSGKVEMYFLFLTCILFFFNSHLHYITCLVSGTRNFSLSPENLFRRKNLYLLQNQGVPCVVAFVL